DRGALLEHADVRVRLELLESDRAREARGARAHDHDVVLHDFSFSHDSAALKRRTLAKAPRAPSQRRKKILAQSSQSPPRSRFKKEMTNRSLRSCGLGR